MRANLALLVEAKLFAQEEVLSGECRLGHRGNCPETEKYLQ